MALRAMMVVAILTISATQQVISILQNGDSSTDVVTNLELSPALDMIHAYWQLLNETGTVDHFTVTWEHNSEVTRQCTVGFIATNTLNCDGAQWDTLSHCTEYTITVQPQTVESSSIGVNASAASNTLAEAPPAPSPVTCSLSGSFVTVTWIAPVTECDIVSNSVSWEGDVLWSDDLDSGDDTAGATDSSFTLSHTVPYTRYTVSVATTIVGGGTGPAGTCQEQLVTPEEAPSAPQNLSFTEIRSMSMVVSWEPPEDINGLLLSYTVEWGVRNDTATKDMDNDTLTYKIRGLEEERNYTISVTAVTVQAGVPAVAFIRTAAISSPDAWALVAIIVIGMAVFALFKRDIKHADTPMFTSCGHN